MLRATPKGVQYARVNWRKSLGETRESIAHRFSGNSTPCGKITIFILDVRSNIHPSAKSMYIDLQYPPAIFPPRPTRKIHQHQNFY